MRDSARRRDRMSLYGTCRNHPPMTGLGLITQEGWKILSPSSKILRFDAWKIVLWVIKDAEHSVGEEFGNGRSHARETLKKECYGLLPEELERIATALGSVRPRIIVIQHVDKYNSKRPDIGGTRTICRSDVVPTFIAHVRRTTTIHVGGLDISSR